MIVVVIGSGGREAALAWKIAESKSVHHVIVMPGNAGMGMLSNKIVMNPFIDVDHLVALKPGLVVVGPEQPLLDGIVDELRKKDILVVGPTKAAAMLEASKDFCKKILIKAKVPTARYQVITNMIEAKNVIAEWGDKDIVVKVDGLAAGKGVIVTDTKLDAENACNAFFDGTYLGTKVKKIVLEDKLIGRELSAFALCDGKDFIILGTAVDHKRFLDQDKGPNTGGMGAVSPAPEFGNEKIKWLSEKVFSPTLKTMSENGTPFTGFLFAGLMETESGTYVLEFNTRLGDPETQSLLPRIESDIVPYLIASARSELSTIKEEIKFRDKIAVHVVLAANGYPGVNGTPIQKEDVISVDEFEHASYLFPAAFKEKNRSMVTNGGRVCGLTTLANNLKDARVYAYSDLKKIKFSNMQFRRDIGEKYL